MDPYAAATSWCIFGGVVVFGCWYYYPRQQHRPQRRDDEPHHATAPRKKRQEQDERGRQSKRPAVEQSSGNDARPITPVNGKASLTKRKAPAQPPASIPSVVTHDEKPEEDDMSTRKWAEGMMQTQRGYDIGSTKSKESRVKTVKQSSAQHERVLSSGSSHGGAEADDDLSPVSSADRPSGDVSDMLEPAPKGPTSLRVTAPTKPQKEKVARQAKEEVVETKKQRQNRKKMEERKLQREAEEQQRRKLEENQRRSAREARGEPAKNGLGSSKPPAVSAWVTSTSTNDTPIANGTHTTPLLDTFDAESMSSSNGGLDPSTGPTSTTSGGAAQWDADLPSEEDQMARAMKQSEDESGWTTVSQQKKTKKKADTPLAEPMLSNKTNLPPVTSKPSANGKPMGFQALEVQYEQRADADPNDASNWDA